MPIEPKFRTVTSFDGPDGLSRGVVQLEENIGRSFDQIVSDALPMLVPTNLKTAAYTAKLDDLVSCNGTFRVTLPVATNKNQGRVVGIIVRAGTVSVGAASGLTQGVAIDSLPVAGLFLYESDGVGWWRAGGVLSVTAGDGTVIVNPTTGQVVIRVGTITSANVDSSIVTLAALRKARTELQYIRLLLMQLVELEQAQ